MLLMLPRDDIRFACVSGTPFGLLVVPDVCRNRAGSPGEGGTGSADAVRERPSLVNSTSAPSNETSMHGTPSCVAASRPG